MNRNTIIMNKVNMAMESMNMPKIAKRDQYSSIIDYIREGFEVCIKENPDIMNALIRMDKNFYLRTISLLSNLYTVAIIEKDYNNGGISKEEVYSILSRIREANTLLLESHNNQELRIFKTILESCGPDNVYKHIN